VARLFALKERAPGKPVLLLVDGRDMLNQVAREVPGLARRLMEKFWPGPLTIIFPSLPHLPRRLTGGTGTIAVRQPRQALTCRLITAWGTPSPAPAPIAPVASLASGRKQSPGSSVMTWT
jgi:L-threonylcarbamoyladenylate synthase